MLQAQIEIVDEAGHTEDLVTIVGAGQVSVGMRAGSCLHTDEATPDLAVIWHSGSRVWVQVKAANALRQHDRYLAQGSIDVVQPVFVAFIEAPRRYLKVRPLRVDGAALLAGGAVIRSTPSSFQSRLDEMAARGAQRVTEQLDRLRTQGKIDDRGNLLVALPDDMRPDSKTDV